jgi:hypothetical protein
MYGGDLTPFKYARWRPAPKSSQETKKIEFGRHPCWFESARLKKRLEA